MDIFSQLGAVSVFVERSVQWVKLVVPYNTIEKTAPYQKQIDVALAALGNMAVCYAWRVDLFTAVGFNFDPAVGALLTGVVASFGSTVAHELIKLLEILRGGTTAPQFRGSRG